MRKYLFAAVAVVALSAFGTSQANAQFPYYGGVNGGFGYVAPPTFGFQNSRVYSNPYYGYRSFNNSGFYTNGYSFGFYQNSGAFQRPVYAGPYHSIYANPGGYSYGPGYRNGNFNYHGGSYYFGW
jgi:hypothetical protein